MKILIDAKCRVIIINNINIQCGSISTCPKTNGDIGILDDDCFMKPHYTKINIGSETLEASTMKTNAKLRDIIKQFLKRTCTFEDYGKLK